MTRAYTPLQRSVEHTFLSLLPYPAHKSKLERTDLRAIAQNSLPSFLRIVSLNCASNPVETGQEREADCVP